jgi:ribosomal RNA-processing protein 36
MFRFTGDDDEGPSLGAQLLRAVTVAPRPAGFRAAAPAQPRAPAPRAPAAARSAGGDEDEDEDEDGSGEEEEQQDANDDEEEDDDSAQAPGAAPAPAAKRSRHAPAELPSTRGVSRHRQVLAVPVAQRRDPRFEASAGALKEDLFAHSYAFLDAKRAQELAELQRAIKRGGAQGDPERARELQAEVARRKQAAAEAQRQAALKESQRALKRGAQAAVAGGARPYFPKQREMRELEAVERFKALEAAGGTAAVEKALKKRRVTLSKKDRTRLPQRGGRPREGE